MELEFETNEKTAKDVLDYLFADNKDEYFYGEAISTDTYFKKVSSYLWSILNTEIPLSEKKYVAPSPENTEKCKRIFNTVLLMMYLPSSLKYNPIIKSFQIDKEIDYNDSDHKSVLYTAIRNVEDFVERIPEEYFTSPASTKYHGAFSGGLMYHSLGVLKAVLDTCDVYLRDKYYSLYVIDISRRDSDIFTRIRYDICSNLPAILLHDFCKVGKYKFIEDKNKWEYNYDSEPSFQHGAESYRRIIHEGFHLSKEWELAVVYHMGVFDVSKQEMMDFSSITEKVPEVLLLHHADMISTKIFQI